VGNYVTDTRPNLGNYMTADTWAGGTGRHSLRDARFRQA